MFLYSGKSIFYFLNLFSTPILKRKWIISHKENLNENSPNGNTEYGMLQRNIGQLFIFLCSEEEKKNPETNQIKVLWSLQHRLGQWFSTLLLQILIAGTHPGTPGWEPGISIIMKHHIYDSNSQPSLTSPAELNSMVLTRTFSLLDLPINPVN